MYGDMFANLQQILSRCPNWHSVGADEFFATSRKDLALVAAQYDVPSQLPALRSQATAFTAELTALLQRAKAAGGGARCTLPRDAASGSVQESVATRARAGAPQTSE